MKDKRLIRQFIFSILVTFCGAYNLYFYFEQPYGTNALILNIILLIGGISSFIEAFIRAKKLK
ncbi:hypothetical protein JCM14719A_15510 [Calditerricola satsumensis]|uniref:Uncharacterized protein n=1 Tax=Calditerricola satsumensis TaxID=373054 RepID=A0A8J3B9D8_9BACI|nr:hypothetical protein GCM10007043_05980 [Calditerricola satsumensis]